MAFEPSEGLYAGLSFVSTADLNAAKNDVGKFKELYFIALENLKGDKVLDAAGNATKNGMIKIIDLDTTKKKPEAKRIKKKETPKIIKFLLFISYHSLVYFY